MTTTSIVSTKLLLKDIIDGYKVRWSIGRNNYLIQPGLYGVGKPNKKSIVLVTANYKLTFDQLRKELSGIDCWILVLDTKGINVWCAAGKGTFGTNELIERIKHVGLDGVVDHKTLILPQLGAVGVSAHKIKQATGFKVIYGPVRASDISMFLKNNYQKTQEMRTVYFNLKDRLVVIPVELVASLKFVLVAFMVFGILSVLDNKAISIKVITDFIPFIGAVLTGTVLFPILLPYIPFRSFALKGFLLGLLWSLLVVWLGNADFYGNLVNFLILPAISSFFALNFTGTSTFTSITGAKLEVKIALPLCIIFVFAGLIIKILLSVHVI